MSGYLQHARRHLPGGTDPLIITDNDPYWQTWFPLPLTVGGGKVGDSPSSGPNFTLDVLTTQPGNVVLTHANAWADLRDSLIYRLSLGPMGWYLQGNFNASAGTLTGYLAGAYDDPTNGIPIAASGAWIPIFAHNFSGGGALAYAGVEKLLDNSGTINPGSVVHISSATPMFTAATALAGGNLNGSSGYYWLRLDFDGAISVNEIAFTSASSVNQT